MLHFQDDIMGIIDIIWLGLRRVAIKMLIIFLSFETVRSKRFFRGTIG